MFSEAGADPGFPVGGGADPQGSGRQHTILSNFPKNCMKLRKFWAVGGGGREPGASPLNPPLRSICHSVHRGGGGVHTPWPDTHPLDTQPLRQTLPW